MLPFERQKQIRHLIQVEKVLRINELSERFNVSEMTIHRDIKRLLEEGLILKTSGGISLAENDEQNFSIKTNVFIVSSMLILRWFIV